MQQTPTPLYTIDTRIESPGLTITFGTQPHQPLRILTTPRLPHTVVEVGAELPWSHPGVQQSIERILLRIAGALAPQLLLPRARQLADDAGLQPNEWRISTGRRTLGTCTSRGVISLSRACVFLPQELRDYIVWHELSHLVEMNHSPRFHAVCNRLSGGREKELTAALRRFRFPFQPRLAR